MFFCVESTHHFQLFFSFLSKVDVLSFKERAFGMNQLPSSTHLGPWLLASDPSKVGGSSYFKARLCVSVVHAPPSFPLFSPGPLTPSPQPKVT